MADILSNSGITNNNTIEAWHVSQSIDAFTAAKAYDISISGSLTVEGTNTISGSLNVSGSVSMPGFNNSTASWATNVVNPPTTVTNFLVPSGSVATSFSTKTVTGFGQITTGQTFVTIDLTPATLNLTAKTLGVDYFITMGVSSSYSTSSFNHFPRVNAQPGTETVQFSIASAATFDVPFFFTLISKTP